MSQTFMGDRDDYYMNYIDHGASIGPRIISQEELCQDDGQRQRTSMTNRKLQTPPRQKGKVNTTSPSSVLLNSNHSWISLQKALSSSSSTRSKGISATNNSVHCRSYHSSISNASCRSSGSGLLPPGRRLDDGDDELGRVSGSHPFASLVATSEQAGLKPLSTETTTVTATTAPQVVIHVERSPLDPVVEPPPGRGFYYAWTAKPNASSLLSSSSSSGTSSSSTTTKASNAFNRHHMNCLGYTEDCDVDEREYYMNIIQTSTNDINLNSNEQEVENVTNEQTYIIPKDIATFPKIKSTRKYRNTNKHKGVPSPAVYKENQTENEQYPEPTPPPLAPPLRRRSSTVSFSLPNPPDFKRGSTRSLLSMQKTYSSSPTSFRQRHIYCAKHSSVRSELSMTSCISMNSAKTSKSTAFLIHRSESLGVESLLSRGSTAYEIEYLAADASISLATSRAGDCSISSKTEAVDEPIDNKQNRPNNPMGNQLHHQATSHSSKSMMSVASSCSSSIVTATQPPSLMMTRSKIMKLNVTNNKNKTDTSDSTTMYLEQKCVHHHHHHHHHHYHDHTNQNFPINSNYRPTNSMFAATTNNSSHTMNSMNRFQYPQQYQAHQLLISAQQPHVNFLPEHSLHQLPTSPTRQVESTRNMRLADAQQQQQQCPHSFYKHTLITTTPNVCNQNTSIPFAVPPLMTWNPILSHSTSFDPYQSHHRRHSTTTATTSTTES